eukprot:TRINITY_DN500_c0_g1_i5.p1 TRINITY_DN500_c0_g1~~TRINITY_DN500_c0_g1_i5.p1  ORF type:complete len:348 (+),score=50.86 TRINITY_DN500_c0_g1_i5:87-1046(+)
MAAPAESLPPESCSSPARQSGWDCIRRRLRCLVDPGLALSCPGVPMAAALWCMLRMPSRVALPEDLLAVCAAFLRREWLAASWVGLDWWRYPDPTVPAAIRFNGHQELLVQGPMPFSEAMLFARDRTPRSICHLFCRGGNLGPRPSTDGWHLAGEYVEDEAYYRLYRSFTQADLWAIDEIIAHPAQGDGREYEVVAGEADDEGLSRAVARARQHPPCRIFARKRIRNQLLLSGGMYLDVDCDRAFSRFLSSPSREELRHQLQERMHVKRMEAALVEQDTKRQLALRKGWRTAQQHRALPPRRRPPRANAGSAARRGQRR